MITTVAGTGVQGFTGDGGPATAAQLSIPFGVAPTADGGFLIVDVGNQRIRKVSAAGVITTVAGNGVAGYSGDGGPADRREPARPAQRRRALRRRLPHRRRLEPARAPGRRRRRDHDVRSATASAATRATAALPPRHR